VNYRVAAIQMASGPNVNANLNETARLILEAANMGAHLITLPESFALMPIDSADNIKLRESVGEGMIQEFLAQQASRHHVWIVGGTLPMVAEAPNKYRAACLVFNPKGQNVGRYDKMHLFDVNVSEQERYYESETMEAGLHIESLDTDLGKLGLVVCYDLRFPELFRCLLDEGVQIITVASAFTAVTGKVHWEVLLRARAIENLCYVIAANQGGYHVNGRETYGNSMIVDPWGAILTRLNRGSGVICADIDLEKQTLLRQHFPCHQHRKIKCHR